MMNEKKMPWGHISIENTTILPGGWRNFGGRASRFNAQGSRFCTIRIDDFDLAEQLISEGWLVKPVMSRNPDVTEPEYYTLKLKIKVYDDSMPDIWVIVSNKKRKLNAESLAMLDTADIISADLEILGRPTLMHEGSLMKRCAIRLVLKKRTSFWQKIDSLRNMPTMNLTIRH